MRPAPLPSRVPIPWARPSCLASCCHMHRVRPQRPAHGMHGAPRPRTALAGPAVHGTIGSSFPASASRRRITRPGPVSSFRRSETPACPPAVTPRATCRLARDAAHWQECSPHVYAVQDQRFANCHGLQTMAEQNLLCSKISSMLCDIIKITKFAERASLVTELARPSVDFSLTQRTRREVIL